MNGRVDKTEAISAAGRPGPEPIVWFDYYQVERNLAGHFAMYRAKRQERRGAVRVITPGTCQDGRQPVPEMKKAPGAPAP